MANAFALFIGRAFPHALRRARGIHAHQVFGVQWELTQGALIAVASMIVLTAVNLRSVKMAAWLQNVTALGYLAAIGVIVVLGILFGRGSWSHFASVPPSGTASISLKGAGVAMIALLWTFDGWEFLSWVAGEDWARTRTAIYPRR